MLSVPCRNRHVGFLVGVVVFGLGAAAADPVPTRPYKPREAPKLPRCVGPERGLDPNGPDFTGSAVRMSKPCAPLPQLKSVQLGRVTVDGQTTLTDIALEAGGLASSTLKGDKLKGAMLLGQIEGDRTVRLRIKNVAVAPDPRPLTPANENADLWLYQVEVQQGTGSDPTDGKFKPHPGKGGEWSALCEKDQQVVVVPGAWDFHVGKAGNAGKLQSEASVVTFACVGSAIAKCAMLMGYKPWKKATPLSGGAAESLDALHQSCVRAVRADYCGNGESLTRPGEQVNFYDRFGIERDQSNWPLEAQWGPNGALCINSTRLLEAPENLHSGRAAVKVRDYIAAHCPERFSEKPCGQTATPGLLLWTEVAPAKSAPAK